jgi:hypothetical protein
MRYAFLVLVCLAGLAGARAQAPTAGLRLLMFEEEECPYCVLWDREVGVVYSRTAEGRSAPLVRTALDDDLPGVILDDPVRFTPTFVLLRDGRELGRITGYPGEAHFWGLLGALLQRNTQG